MTCNVIPLDRMEISIVDIVQQRACVQRGRGVEKDLECLTNAYPVHPLRDTESD